MKKNELVEAIVSGLQEKKGKNIVIADLRGIETSVCDYFVICSGGSPTQVQALARSVGDAALAKAGAKAVAVNGLQHSLWVAMDFGEAMVHIFMPEERAFYDIEHLWADAETETLEDVD